MPTRPLCLHCGKEFANRPRGLGFRCYYLPSIRDLYPWLDVKANRVGSGAYVKRPKRPQPTLALPGTPEKEAVLTERAELGQQLFNPLDARRTE